MARVFIFGLSLVLLLLPLSEVRAETVKLGSSPAYPTPNQAVTLTARSSVPKGAYLYSWTVNGSLLTEGYDLTTVTIISGAGGTETSVEVVLIDDEGDVVGSDIYVVRPGSVEIIWEGKTYVPPFYRGKPYPNGDSQITLQAIPHLSSGGKEFSDGDLVYQWEVDGKNLGSQSGYGKSSLTIRPTSFRNTTTVTVVVETRDGLNAAKGVAAIPIVAPKIIVYEDTPLGGLQFNRAIPANFAFTGTEMTFWAVPFFTIDPKILTYGWTLNGSPFELDSTEPSVATFRKTGEGGGTFSVGITAQKSGHIFEKAAKTFNLIFE